MSNVLKSKRFVVRQSLVGKNQVIEFTNKKGESYTATNNLPTVLRGKKLV